MIAHDDPSEIGIRVGFAMMFAFIGLSFKAHVEPFLGAFIAGAILSFVIRDKGALEHKLSSMAYGFFVPIFFIDVGMNLKITPQLLFNNYQTILTIIVVMGIIKFVPAVLLMMRGLKFQEVLATTCLLAAPLTLVIAIMEMAFLNEKSPQTPKPMSSLQEFLASLLYPSLARKLLKPPAPASADGQDHAAK